MKYEFMAIVKPFLPEDVRNKLVAKLKKLFVDNGGKVVKEDIWGKRHLAYKIDGHEEGYYVLYFVEMPKDGLSKVKEELKMTSDLLRYIIIKGS
jgi:small subunit ribosomal protein S6